MEDLAAKLRVGWRDESAFWVAVVAQGLDIMRALKEAEDADEVQGPWMLVKPKAEGDEDDLPF